MEIFVHAAARFADDACAVCLVHHQKAAVLLFQPYKCGHVGNIAIHAVGSLDNDQHLFIALALRAQNAFQRGRVVVRKRLCRGGTQAATLLDGVMRQRVVYDQVVLATKIAYERHVCGVPAHAHQRAFGMLPVRQLALQLLVQALFSRQQPAAARTGTIPVDSVLCGLLHLGPAAHPHIVIAAEIQHLMPRHQAFIPQGRIVAHKVRIVLAGSHQSLLPLQKRLILRRVLKADNGRGVLPWRVALAFIGDVARQLVVKQRAQIADRGTASIFLHWNQHAEKLLHLQRDRKHLKAVSPQLVDKVRVVRKAARVHVQRFRVKPSHLCADFLQRQVFGPHFP